MQLISSDLIAYASRYAGIIFELLYQGFVISEFGMLRIYRYTDSVYTYENTHNLYIDSIYTYENTHTAYMWTL